MATKLEDPKDTFQKEQNKRYGFYKSREKLTDDAKKSAQDGGSHKLLRDGEKKADGQEHETRSKEGLYKGETSKPKKKKGSLKKRLTGGGLVASLLLFVFSFATFLVPLKANFIHALLDNKFSSGVDNIVEARTERLFASYLSQTVKGATAQRCGSVIGKNCIHTYSGSGAELFTIWRDFNIETALDDYGINIEYDKRTRGGTVEHYAKVSSGADSIEITGDGADPNTRRGGKHTLSRNLSRAVNDANADLHWTKRSVERFATRSYAARKYGAKRFCLLLCNTRDNYSRSRAASRIKYKLAFIERVVSPMSERLSLYMTCIVSGCGDTSDEFSRKYKDREIRLVKEPTERLQAELMEEIAEEWLEELTEASGEKVAREAIEALAKDAAEELLEKYTRATFRQVILKHLFSKVLGPTLGTAVGGAAAKAIPIVGLVLLYDMLATVEIAIDDNQISKMLADQNTAQYVDTFLLSASVLGEQNSGQLTAEEVGAYVAMYDGFEKSRYYQNGFTSLSDSGDVINTDTSGRVCRNGGPIADGQLVCPEQLIDRQVFLEEWVDNPLWAYSVGLTVDVYTANTILVSPLPWCAGVNKSIRDCVHPIVTFAGDVLGGITEALISVIPGLGSLVGLLEENATKIGEKVLALFEPVLTDVPVGPLAFEAVAAGADVFNNEFIRDQLGGDPVSPVTKQASYELAMSEDQEEFESKSLWSRMFDFSDQRSLAYTVATRASIDLGGKSNISLLARLTRNIASAPSSFAKLVSTPSPLYATGETNIFGAFGNLQFDVPLSGGAIDIDPATLTTEVCNAALLERAENKKLTEVTGEEYYDHTDVQTACLIDDTITTTLACYLSDDSACSNPDRVSELALAAEGIDPETLQAVSNFGSNLADDANSLSGAGTNKLFYSYSSVGDFSITPSILAGASIIGNAIAGSADVSCAYGTEDLGVHGGWLGGAMRLCAVSNISAGGDESTPGSAYYVEGAKGRAIVNSRVSGAWYALANAAKEQGVVMKAGFTYRTHAHQIALCNNREGCKNGTDYSIVAKPGTSLHEAGIAIDFSINAPKTSNSCSNRATAGTNPMWAWLYQNAENFGFKQYSKEAWHWDTLNSSNRCGAGQR